ncbi:MAG: response regulator transcription factor, partial [Bacteroidota bacterium]
MNEITILIADDHKLIRETWCFLLNADPRFKVVSEAANGGDALELAKQHHPDIAIMDIDMPVINGMEATEQITKFCPGTKIISVSMHSQPVYVKKMMQKGALGYVTKSSSCEEMYKAIIEVHNNRKYICEEVKNILSKQMLSGDEERNGFDNLSKRELEIIGFIRKGYSSREIADPLCISVKTVEVHRYNILKKLNLKNTAAMVNYINKNQMTY